MQNQHTRDEGTTAGQVDKICFMCRRSGGYIFLDLFKHTSEFISSRKTSQKHNNKDLSHEIESEVG